MPRAAGARATRGLLLALAAAALVSCGQQRPGAAVWFAPNIGSTDMLALFTQPARWSHARPSVGVFKFYSSQILATNPTDCPTCGDNRFPGFVQVNAFRLLQQWRIATALEVGAVKSYACTGAETAPPVVGALDRVRIAGGAVTYLAADEPRLSTPECNQTPDETAAQVADFVQRVHASYPQVAVGDIEPYPILSVADLEGWIEALRSHGFTPAFLHLDVDRVYAARVQADVGGDLAALEGFCAQRNLPFGVIVWGEDSRSDEAYYDDALVWVDRVNAAIGRPPQVIFQSWIESTNGSKTVPTNLPDDDPSIFSHTRLIADGLTHFASR